MQENSKQIYFASANSARGFVSYFERCFADARVSRLYMIKGGPGTGKSRFIGDVATEAARLGWHAEYYACSSDPGSLDGVILTHPRHGCIALADSTAPHVMEPTLPGVRDVIVNLGDFWDREKLAKHAARIRTLMVYKQACFDRSYAYLSAAGKMLTARDSLIAPCVDGDKITRLAAKISRLYPKGRDFDERIGLSDSIGMRGRVHFDTYERAADRIVVLSPFYGVEYTLMDALYRMAKERGCAVRRAPHVLFSEKTATLYFPDNRLCVTASEVQNTAGKDVQRIDLRRACDPDALRGVRGEARLAEKLADSAIDAAADSFARAGEYHFELESIYTAAMNFDAKEHFTATFCNAILQNP
jgi:hypothetical protein